MVRELPTVFIRGQKYYVDERLREYRNCANPHVRIPFSQMRIIIPKNQLKKTEGFL